MLFFITGLFNDASVSTTVSTVDTVNLPNLYAGCKYRVCTNSTRWEQEEAQTGFYLITTTTIYNSPPVGKKNAQRQLRALAEAELLVPPLYPIKMDSIL